MTPIPTNPADMLKKLDPVVRPMSADRMSEHAGAMESLSFASLIHQSVTRPISTGETVILADDIAADELDMDRLSAAADEAAAAGSRRAVILMDGRALVLDVGRRRIDDELRGQDLTSRLSTGIDTAILAQPVEEETASELSVLTRLSNGPWPTSVADLFEHESTESETKTPLETQDESGRRIA